ncbi:hypothetical protein BZG36_00974 [Bifiguratus adelaidae]|uniref:Zn(2)-C6 fungal-type domain-containing protein n=1 Tax=Bifiguratus adelaidae TaxID=1938954 RepID=A0A261Y6C5_9FUNG|nr:hypothetical protein BZG36_00974 [Bifiguratus adelaidae]
MSLTTPDGSKEDLQRESVPSSRSDRVIRRLKVGRACYTCRLKKIKCDGLQPCMQCKARRRPCSFSRDGALNSPDEWDELGADAGDAATNGSSDSPPSQHISSDADTNSHQYAQNSPHEGRYTSILRHLSSDSNELYIRNPSTAGDLQQRICISDHRLRAEPRLPKRYRGSLQMPPRETQGKLIDTYFQYLYGFFPVVPKQQFIRQMQQKGPLISPLLLNMIFAHASKHFLDESFRTDPRDPFTHGDVFYERAKSLIGDFLDEARVGTIFALLLMSTYEHGSTIDPSKIMCVDYETCQREQMNATPLRMGSTRSWTYAGMAIRMALDLGLHLNVEASVANYTGGNDDFEVKRRIVWGCYCVDKVLSSLNRRPCMLPTSVITEALPQSQHGDDEEELHILEGFLANIRLMQIWEKIISISEMTAWNARMRMEIPSQQQQVTAHAIKGLEMDMSSWLLSLPASLQWNGSISPETGVGNLTALPPVNPITANLHFMFNAALLQTAKFTATSYDYVNLQRSCAAAQVVSQLAKAMTERIFCVNNFSVIAHGLLTASLVVISDFVDGNGSIRSQAQHIFRRNMDYLSILLHCRVIDGVMPFLDLIMNELGLDSRQLASSPSLNNHGIRQQGQHVGFHHQPSQMKRLHQAQYPSPPVNTVYYQPLSAPTSHQTVLPARNGLSTVAPMVQTPSMHPNHYLHPLPSPQIGNGLQGPSEELHSAHVGEAAPTNSNLPYGMLSKPGQTQTNNTVMSWDPNATPLSGTSNLSLRAGHISPPTSNNHLQMRQPTPSLYPTTSSSSSASVASGETPVVPQTPSDSQAVAGGQKPTPRSKPPSRPTYTASQAELRELWKSQRKKNVLKRPSDAGQEDDGIFRALSPTSNVRPDRSSAKRPSVSREPPDDGKSNTMQANAIQ